MSNFTHRTRLHSQSTRSRSGHRALSLHGPTTRCRRSTRMERSIMSCNPPKAQTAQDGRVERQSKQKPKQRLSADPAYKFRPLRPKGIGDPAMSRAGR